MRSDFANNRLMEMFSLFPYELESEWKKEERYGRVGDYRQIQFYQMLQIYMLTFYLGYPIDNVKLSECLSCKGYVWENILKLWGYFQEPNERNPQQTLNDDLDREIIDTIDIYKYI